jgi:hypothetical protein
MIQRDVFARLREVASRMRLAWLAECERQRGHDRLDDLDSSRSEMV